MTGTIFYDLDHSDACIKTTLSSGILSGRERIRERIRTIYISTKAIPTYLSLPRGGVDP